MQHRINWKELQGNSLIQHLEFNFKWQQNLLGIDFNTLNSNSHDQVNMTL